jgi:hypothetical protein
MKLTDFEKQLIDRARKAAAARMESDINLIGILADVDKHQTYKKLGYTSLFMYAVNDLKFEAEQAYPLITLARKGNKAPAFLNAIMSGDLTIGIANRVVSAITFETAEELIEFAKTHTAREINNEVELRAGRPVKGKLSFDTKELLKRARSILSTKYKRPIESDEAMRIILSEFLDKHDPVKKAARAEQKPRAQKPQGNGVRRYRVPLTAKQKHEVNLRDQGRCTFRLANGQRCPNDRWIEHHHKIHVSQGGTNDPENITTLCAQHHDLVHQMQFDLARPIASS